MPKNESSLGNRLQGKSTFPDDWHVAASDVHCEKESERKREGEREGNKCLAMGVTAPVTKLSCTLDVLTLYIYFRSKQRKIAVRTRT